MNQWISKLRLQKTRVWLKQSEDFTFKEPAQIWDSYVASLFLAFFTWFLTCVLMYAGRITPSETSTFMTYSGDGILLLIGLLVAITFLRVIEPSIMQGRPRIVLLMFLITFFTLLPIRLLLFFADTTTWLRLPVVEFLFPIAIAPLLGTILIGSGVGLVMGVWTAYVAAIFADKNLIVFMAGLVATGIAACMAHNVRKRSHVFKLGLIIGLAQIYIIIALAGQPQEGPPGVALIMAVACLISGIVSAIVALLVLPLLESVFGITTDITLLELSDLGHPLLQRLAIEAPGTYHHSLVASLAQAAADEIKANSLLVRVGAYFHDIGKLTKPDLFSENIRIHENPHDELSPNMSALLITAHVKEGISMAILSKLPLVIIDIIQQHHGTSLVSYFHHKAKVLLEKENGARAGIHATINESDFRYPGPQPLTREAAIVLLADAVEAASRSLAKPTPNHIRNLIDEIVNEKMQDGQLDMCAMTLAELKQIKEAFIFTLSNMAHSRIPYPKNENRNSQPAVD